MTLESVSEVEEVDFDHNLAEVNIHRIESFASLRQRCPIVHSSSYDGYYIVTGFEEAGAAVRQPSLFTSREGPAIPPFPIHVGMQHYDPPYGSKFRREINRSFTPALAEQNRVRAQEVVDEHIDAFIEMGYCDLLGQLTGVVPALLTSEGLGLPLDHFKIYASLWHDLLSLSRDSEGFAVAGRRLNDFLADVSEVIDARIADPQDDWISALATLEVGGEHLSKEQILENVNLIFAGGVDTTTQATSQSLFYLHKDHELRNRLRTDPSLIPQACEEFLRYVSPFQGTARTLESDTELGGKLLQGGNRVLIVYGAANRDPRMFGDPDTLDIDRPRQRNLAFGEGVHKCLGQHHARIWMQVMLRSVLERLPDYVADDSRVREFESFAVAGLYELPVTFTPGRRGGKMNAPHDDGPTALIQS